MSIIGVRSKWSGRCTPSAFVNVSRTNSLIALLALGNLFSRVVRVEEILIILPVLVFVTINGFMVLTVCFKFFNNLVSGMYSSLIDTLNSFLVMLFGFIYLYS